MRPNKTKSRHPERCCKGGGRRGGGGGGRAAAPAGGNRRAAGGAGGTAAPTLDRRLTRNMNDAQMQRLSRYAANGATRQQLTDASRQLRRAAELEGKVATLRVQRARDRAQTELDQIKTQLRNLGI